MGITVGDVVIDGLNDKVGNYKVRTVSMLIKSYTGKSIKNLDSNPKGSTILIYKNLQEDKNKRIYYGGDIGNVESGLLILLAKKDYLISQHRDSPYLLININENYYGYRDVNDIIDLNERYFQIVGSTTPSYIVDNIKEIVYNTVEKSFIKGIYKHFKGGIYKVIGISNSCDTLEKQVIYLDKDNKCWTRNYEEFFSLVEIDGKEVPRFEKLKKGGCKNVRGGN